MKVEKSMNFNLMTTISHDNITEFYKFHKEVCIDLSQIGRGASGVCYKVSSKEDPKKFYCVKKIHKKKGDPEGSIQEILFLDQISHPDIVRLY